MWAELVKWPPAAPHVFIFAFSVLAIALLGLGVYFVWSINYSIVAITACVLVGIAKAIAAAKPNGRKILRSEDL